jgi:hypothetical protein
MRRSLLLGGAAAVAVTAFVPAANGADGQIRLRAEGANTFIQVRGDADEDWRFQISTDLVTWSNATTLGTLLSGGTNAPWRSVGDRAAPRCFYRALKTAGLYDPTLLRTISLTFTQSNWQTLLANGRTTGSNVLCSLVMDNGTAIYGVGARYKGNTSYTGMGPGGAPTKKSLNIELDYTNSQSRLMGYKTVNLNNACGDETIMREPLYFDVMQDYTVCPKASLVKLYINGTYWGVYSFAQQPNSDLMKEWFPSNDGDRWRAPNVGGGGAGGGGGFNSALSALSYLGTNVAAYQKNYELKTDNSTNAWQRLIHATDVLNNTSTNQLRDKVEDVLAVDRWLWFLAIENVFTDEDSYYYKGADYVFYYEPESGGIHPVEYDGNESYVPTDVSLSPVQGASSANRPVLRRLLGVAELRQRYLAHLRTVLQESFNPAAMTPLINQYSALSIADIAADTKKGYTMTAYNNDLAALKTFVTNRCKFLTNHAELRPVPPTIVAVYAPAPVPTASQVPYITAQVRAYGTEGISSVWLYHRAKSYGRFTAVQMFDDGAHGDGLANDGIFGAATTNYPAGAKVRYYVEARSANSAKAASFAPARAEQETYSYRVGLITAPNTPVVINEFMASNSRTLADPQGEYDDWIELHNLTDQEVDLTGHYLSDEPNNPRKWQFPSGTKIAADGYLLVWADEDVTATPGLHASFKLAASGEQVYLTDTDANLNAVLDYVIFGAQHADRSYGRLPDDPDTWGFMDPTPGLPKH